MKSEKTSKCPKCGCAKYINENIVGDGYRKCLKCGQEWWLDIDYESHNDFFMHTVVRYAS